MGKKSGESAEIRGVLFCFALFGLVLTASVCCSISHTYSIAELSLVGLGSLEHTWANAYLRT